MYKPVSSHIFLDILTEKKLRQQRYIYYLRKSLKNISPPSKYHYKRPWQECYISKKFKKPESSTDETFKLNRLTITQSRPLEYPYKIILDEIEEKKNPPLQIKTFQYQFTGSLSPLARFILKSFRHKYIYYAIDDILYSLDSSSKEYHDLLEFLKSSMICLQNYYCTNFFDIWIENVYIMSHPLSSTRNPLITIKLRLYYIVKPPIPKLEPLW